MYLDNFNSIDDIVNEYSGRGSRTDDSNEIRADLEGAEILLAWYGYGSYSGSSFVLYRKNGNLYEVNGSHCSCYGLEGQWGPEETSWEALMKKEIDSGWGYDGENEAQAILNRLIAENVGPNKEQTSSN